jgi:hypothetical protein
MPVRTGLEAKGDPRVAFFVPKTAFTIYLETACSYSSSPALSRISHLTGVSPAPS